MLSVLVNLICASLFIKIYDLMTLSMNLKKLNVFFFTLGNMDIWTEAMFLIHSY